tara:strand:+ start:95 stop:793 length:699 start_codon:yes stop_codon:yes gene_type:complete
MKKIALSSATLITLMVAPSAFADFKKPQFYGGAQAGGTFAMSSLKMDSRSGGAPVGFVDQQIKQKRERDFFSAGVFAGFRFCLTEFFTGLEVEGNWDGMNIKFDTPHPNAGFSWRTEIKRKYQIIPSLTVGWKATEKASLYAKFGAGISKFSIKTEVGDPSQRGQNRTIIHFVPALGAEYEVHENAALRFEVSGEVFGPQIKSENVAGPATFQSTKTQYHSLSAKLGVLLKV